MKETWTKSKYSVNIKEAPKSNEKTIRKKQCKKQATCHTTAKQQWCDLKILETSTHAKPSIQPQLASQTTTHTEQKKTSNVTAKKGKSTIPARRLNLLNRHNGSLIQLDSLKDLGILDNNSKNTFFKPQNNTYTNLNSDNPTTSKDVTITIQPLLGKNSITPINIYNPKNLHINPSFVVDKTSQQSKFFWIHDYITSAEHAPKLILILKLAPKLAHKLSTKYLQKQLTKDLKFAPK